MTYRDDLVFSSESLGLTKREYFAAMAMQGLISHGIETTGKLNDNLELAANGAVNLADALIKELSK